MDRLIFDRTRTDVEEALGNPNSSQMLKGTYNYIDINRVEEWCKYIYEELEKYGFKEELVIKINWSILDFPTRIEIDRIRTNIYKLKDYCYSLLSEEIAYNNTLDYQQANILEKVLFDINEHFKNLTIIKNIKYGIGTNLIQNKYITSKVDTETLGENYIINMNINIGATLIKNKYIEMKGA